MHLQEGLPPHLLLFPPETVGNVQILTKYSVHILGMLKEEGLTSMPLIPGTPAGPGGPGGPSLL